MRQIYLPSVPLVETRDVPGLCPWPSISEFWHGLLATNWGNVVVGGGNIIHPAYSYGWPSVYLRVGAPGDVAQIHHNEVWPMRPKAAGAQFLNWQGFRKVTFETNIWLYFDHGDVDNVNTYFGFANNTDPTYQITVRIHNQNLCLHAWDSIIHDYSDYDFLIWFTGIWFNVRIVIYQAIGGTKDGWAELWIDNELKVINAFTNCGFGLNTHMRPVFRIQGAVEGNFSMRVGPTRVYYDNVFDAVKPESA